MHIEPKLKENFLSAEDKKALFLKAVKNHSPDNFKKNHKVALCHYPVTSSQKRIWFLNKFEDNYFVSNTIKILKFKGKVDVNVLRQAIETIISRHEILRSVFPVIDHTVMQKYLNFHINDIFLYEKINNESLTTKTQRELLHKFSLENGPLCRFVFLEVSPEVSYLVINMHHIICDGWSFAVLMNEMQQIYKASVDRYSLNLPALDWQYSDYALWQEQNMNSVEYKSSLGWWKNELETAPALLDLPLDYRRPKLPSYECAAKTIVIDSSLTSSLKQYAAEFKTSLFTVLLTAYSLLLEQYTQQSDLVIGVPIAGRSKHEVEKLIGLFVNTLAIRINVSHNQSFSQMIETVKKKLFSAYENQNTAFDEIVNILQPERNQSYSPLFQTLFAFQNITPPSYDFGSEVIVEDVAHNKRYTEFDLSIYGHEVSGRLIFRFEYRKDLFKETTIDQMASMYQSLLTELLVSPDRHLYDIKLLPKVALEMQYDWNKTETKISVEKLCHHYIEDQAKILPNRIAVKYLDTELTYEALNIRANQLAHYLISKGNTGEIIAIYLDRSIGMVISILAILKAGCAYLPIPVDLPTERIQYMFQNSGCKLIVTSENKAEIVQELLAHEVILIDKASEKLIHHSADNPQIDLTPEAVAYVIYTSGSTGKPKGVANTHVGLLNRLVWMQKEIKLNSMDKVLQKTPYGFDVSVWEFLLPLMYGSQLVVAEPEGHKEPKYLAEIIKREKISVIHFVPSMLQVFIDSIQINTLSSLRCIICSGEALLSSTSNTVLEKLTNCAIYNFYGPTEAAIDVSFYRCKNDDKQNEIVSIGRPIDNIKLYVLSKNFKPVPVGVPGELFISGVGLATGYLNNRVLTEERFIKNSIGETYGHERLYRTGDLVKYTEDGNLHYIGRMDYQVKIRGFRIEPGEIESILNNLPDVLHSAVVVQYIDNKPQYLVAYLVPRKGNLLNTEDVRKHCQNKLPEYMVPKFIVFLEEIPLTSSGKVDRKLLPLPEVVAQRADIIPLRSATDLIITEIWEKLLNTKIYDIGANFFDLGGHSLLAIKCMSMIEEKLSVKIKLKDFFASPTIQILSKMVDAEIPKAKLHFIEAVSQDDFFPASYSQEYTFGLAKEYATTTLFNLCDAAEIIGKLDVTRFQEVLQNIVNTNNILRTNFIEASSDIRQNVFHDVTVDLPVFHFSTNNEAESFINKNFNLPFTLGKGLLFRFCLIKLSDNCHWFVFNRHMLISDCQSFISLMQEFSMSYDKKSISNRKACNKLQYADYAYSQKKWISEGIVEDQISYWKKYLMTYDGVKNFPVDIKTPIKPDYKGETLRFDLSSEVSKNLMEYAVSQGVTLFMLLMSIFRILMYQFTAQNDLVIGFPVTHRTREEIENSMGYFNNILFLRNKINAHVSFSQLLKDIKTDILAAYSNKDIPFEYLDSLYKQINKHKLYDVHFSFRNMDVQMPQNGLLQAKMIDFPVTSSFQYIKMVTLYKEGKIHGGINYSFDLFRQATIKNLISRYSSLCEKILDNPETSLKDILSN